MTTHKNLINNFIKQLNFSITMLKYNCVEHRNLEHIKVKEFEKEFLVYLELLKKNSPRLYHVIITDLKNSF